MRRAFVGKAAAVLAGFLACSFLAGCGSQAPAAGTPAAGEKQKVVLWHLWTGTEAGYVDDAVKDYNSKSEKYEVESVSTPDTQKIMVAIQAGNGPDITDDFSNNVGGYASKGIMLPLDERIAQAGYDLSNFIPSALESCRYDGKLYAFPVGMNLMALFYNKTLLADAGYTEPPKTLEELYDMAVKTTQINPDGTIDVIGFPDFPSVYYADNIAAAAGGDWYQNAMPTPADNAGNLLMLHLAVNYRKQFGVDNVMKFQSSGKYLDPADPFLAGKQVFRIDGNWLGMNIKETFKVDVDYGATLIPYPKDHPELAGRGIASSSMYYIPANTKVPDGAFDFLRYIAGPEGTMIQTVSHGGFPARLSQLDSDEFQKGSYNADVFTQLASGKNLYARPNVTWGTEYATVCAEQVELCLNLKQSPEDTLKNIYEQGMQLANAG